MKKLKVLGLALLVLAGFVLMVGCEGPAGPAGPVGETGAPGNDPTIEISSDGFWVINGVTTNKKAAPATIEISSDGYWKINGVTTSSKATAPTIDISSGGNWIINGVETATKAVGTNGTNGTNGTDGITPTISDDGYWVINGQKTTVKAVGVDGTNGTNGTNGSTPLITISNDGYWVINNQKTTTKATGPTFLIDSEGYWVINGQKTNAKATGPTITISDGYWVIDGVKSTSQVSSVNVTINDDGYWVINGAITNKKAESGGSGGSAGPWDATGPDWSAYTTTSANYAVTKMVTGFNLGNTFDMLTISVDGLERSTDFPPTTEANILALKAAGFNAIRLPVTWSNGIKTAPASANNYRGDYRIHPTYLARIGKVVHWIIDNGMYCIMDSHHTDSIFGNAGLYDVPTRDSTTAPPLPDGSPPPGSMSIETSAYAMKELYTEVGNYFKDYSHLLIIEALNEPKSQTPNKAGVQPNTWAGGTAEQHRNLNYLYQVFVDTIRATGGKNVDRLLAFPTYAASATELAMSGLTLPTDLPGNRGFNNKLIVDIHAYNPYRYTLCPDMAILPVRQDGDSYYTDWTETSTHPDTGPLQMKETLNLAVKYFISKGIPVIWGEVSVVNRYKYIYQNAVRTTTNAADAAQGTGNYVRTKIDGDLNYIPPESMSWEFNHESREAWTEYFWKQGKERGIPFFWWDNGHLFYTAADGGTTTTSRFTHLKKADGSQVVVGGKLGASVNGNNEFNVLLNRYDNTFPYPYLLKAIQRAVGLPESVLPEFNPDVIQPAQYWTNGANCNTAANWPQ